MNSLVKNSGHGYYVVLVQGVVVFARSDRWLIE